MNINKNQYVKKKLGNYPSKFTKNEKIKEKSERYEDTPSKSSGNEKNNSPLIKKNMDYLNLSEKNIVVNSIKRKVDLSLICFLPLLGICIILCLKDKHNRAIKFTSFIFSKATPFSWNNS